MGNVLRIVSKVASLCLSEVRLDLIGLHRRSQRQAPHQKKQRKRRAGETNSGSNSNDRSLNEAAVLQRRRTSEAKHTRRNPPTQKHSSTRTAQSARHVRRLRGGHQFNRPKSPPYCMAFISPGGGGGGSLICRVRILCENSTKQETTRTGTLLRTLGQLIRNPPRRSTRRKNRRHRLQKPMHGKFTVVSSARQRSPETCHKP